MRRHRPSGDEGSVLVLVLGFFAILLVLVAVVADVSAVVLAKRGVGSAADGAAVAASQSLDLDELYRGGLGAQIPLSREDAARRVAAYEVQARTQQPGLELTVAVVDRTAIVTGTRRVRLPFRLPGSQPVLVRSVARARAPVVG